MFGQELERIILPESIEELDAKKGDMGGIGFARLMRDDNSANDTSKVRFEIPRTAKPEVIAYLQKEWGKDNVILVAPKNRKEQTLLPVVMMKQKTARGHS